MPLRSVRLAGVATAQDFDWRLEQNSEVKPKTPVVDVPEIVFDASCDRGRRGSWSPASIHLCPACQSGLYASAERIISDDLVELVVMSHRVRA